MGRRVEGGAVEVFGLQVYETSLPVMVLESLYTSGSFLEKKREILLDNTKVPSGSKCLWT